MAQQSLKQALKEYLWTVTSLTDLVSWDDGAGGTNTPNIRPRKVTQETERPYITFSRIAMVDDQELDGTTTFATETIAFNIVGESDQQVSEVQEQLRLNLMGFQRKLMPPDKTEAQGAIWINSTRRTNSYDFDDSPQTGDQYIPFNETEIYDFGIPLPDNLVHPPNLI